MTMKEKMNLRHDIWFSLSVNQRRKLTANCIYANNLYDCPVWLFVKVTRSKKLLSMMQKLWQNEILQSKNTKQVFYDNTISI